MAVFNGMTITSAGENMLAQAIDGQGTLIFTSMSTSTQQISGNLDSIVALTDIKQTVTPTSAVINNNAIQVTGDFTNVSVQQQYDVNTIGLYAKLGNGTEMLFAVASASTPDTIPAQSTPFTFSYVFNVAVSNTAQIVVNIEGGGTSNYNDLFNKPQLNGVDLIGNKTLDDVGAVAKNQGTGNAGKVLGIGENGIVTPMESGGGIPGQDGEDGGYYTPTVTQPTDETMQMSFAASKPSMPPVQPVTINLPSGGDALNGLPSGGTAGQVLSKKTNTDYDVEWTDAPVGGDTPRQQMQNTDTTVTLEPNILYVFPEMASLTVTLGTPSDTNVANEYHFFFTSGQTATTLTLNDVLSDAYSIDANMKYEVSILEGVAYIKGVSTGEA